MDDGREPVGTVVILWPPALIRDWKEDTVYASHSEMFPLFQYYIEKPGLQACKAIELCPQPFTWESRVLRM